MLSEPELDGLRSVASGALPGTAIVETKSYTDNGGGGGTLGWTAAGTVACRIAPLSGSEMDTAERITAEGGFIVTLPYDTDLDETARLQIDGGTYNVAFVRSRSWDITKRVEVTRET